MDKYRHEIKISINTFDKYVLSSKLSHLLKKDKHTAENGYYLVRSLYFDDCDNSALNNKLLGLRYREKFRIRTYGQESSTIKLEKKVKNGGVGFKESALLSRTECESLLQENYNFLLYRPEMICRELYIKMKTGLFKPKTIVQYDREAYEWNPGNIRITIDSNIQTGLSSTDFFNTSIPLVAAIDKNTSILEIKYNNYLPAHIANVVQVESRQRGALSKYVLSRRFG